MKFWEAMKCLEEGKRVRKTSWAENRYLYIDEDGSFYDNREQIPILYTVGTEWEIYDDRKEAPYVLRKLAIELSQFDSDLNSLITTEDKKLIAELLVTLECKYKF